MSNYLTEKTKEALLFSDKERIHYILTPKWIGYPVAKNVINKLSDLLVHPKTHRMPNMLIIGETNNGKTMIAKKFFKMHPADLNEDGDSAKIPVLLVQSPPVPDEGRFYNNILKLLMAPHKTSDRIDKKEHQVRVILENVGTKMLIVDEIHHVLAGSLYKQKSFLNVIKYLGNELQIPIVGIGIKDAEVAINTEPQLANRFERVRIPKWKLDQDFVRFLMSFERLLPLKKQSNLHQSDMAHKIHLMSEGFVGELTTVINKAAIQAIKDQTEKISIKTLNKLNWVGPSERKKHSNRS